MIGDGDFILEVYGGTAWRNLRTSRWPGWVFHGQDLVMAYEEVADNVDHARQTLRAAERLGIIERRSYRPTREQQFFGLNGRFGREVLDPKKTGRDEVAYEWEFA